MQAASQVLAGNNKIITLLDHMYPVIMRSFVFSFTGNNKIITKNKILSIGSFHGKFPENQAIFPHFTSHVPCKIISTGY